MPLDTCVPHLFTNCVHQEKTDPVPRYLVRRFSEANYLAPDGWAAGAEGYRRWNVVGEATGATHTGFAVCELDPGGSLPAHLHSFEETFYVLDGSATVSSAEGLWLVVPGDYGLFPVGVPHLWRNESGGPVRWAEMQGPQPRSRFAGQIDHLVLAAIERDQNTAAGCDIGRALRLTTLKLVGYLEAIHVLLPRMSQDSAVVLFGGLAKDRPYPGSTTVSTINGGVTTMIHTLAVELSPIRFNAIHPGIVGDSPFWSAKPAEVIEGYRSRTPTGRLATMAEIADAVEFLLRNPSVNGQNLNVDGGWLLT